jgi:hypothetical protein
MKKKTELQKLLSFLKKTGVFFSTWQESEFIDDGALKAGAVVSVSIRDSVHLSFDKKGKLVGSSTDSVNSFKKRKK